jgi:hypothetical protein
MEAGYGDGAESEADCGSATAAKATVPRPRPSAAARDIFDIYFPCSSLGESSDTAEARMAPGLVPAKYFWRRSLELPWQFCSQPVSDGRSFLNMEITGDAGRRTSSPKPAMAGRGLIRAASSEKIRADRSALAPSYGAQLAGA